jgi:hypothetical protein
MGNQIEGRAADITEALSPGVIDKLNSLITLTVIRGGIQTDVSLTLTAVTELERRNKLWRLHQKLHNSISTGYGSTGMNCVLDSENRWRLEGSTTVKIGTRT